MSKKNIIDERSDENGINKRILIVYDMLLSGLKRNEIFENCCNKKGKLNWDVTLRQVDNYIAKAKILIEKENDKHCKYEYSKTLARYENLYAKSMKIQDYKTCIKILEQKSRLMNLNNLNNTNTDDVQVLPKTDKARDLGIKYLRELNRDAN